MCRPKRVQHSGTPVERFWPKVNKNGLVPDGRPDLGPCWQWMFGMDREGYGRFKIKGRWALAHRCAYEFLIGPLSCGLELDHLCRNHGCVKVAPDEHGPAHLEAITHQENVLRGSGPTAINAAKTHCVNGHPFDRTNTYYPPTGGRGCRLCNAEAVIHYKGKGSTLDGPDAQ